MPLDYNTQVYSGSAKGIAVSPDGATIYVVKSSSILVLDAMTGELETTFAIDAELRGIDISMDGSTLAIATLNGTRTPFFVTIDLATGVATEHPIDPSLGGNFLNDVAFLADGSLVIARQTGPVLLYNLAAEAASIIPGLERFSSMTLVTSPDRDQVYGQYASDLDRRFIYTMGEGVTAQVFQEYDPYSGASTHYPPHAFAGALSANGEMAVDNFTITGSDVTTRTATISMAIVSGVFSPDNTRFYGVTADGHVVIYDPSDWHSIGSIKVNAPLLMPVPMVALNYTYGDLLTLSPDGSALYILSTTGIVRVSLADAPLQSTGGDDVLSGAGTLLGLDGNDRLGGAGAQIMYGGRGDDVYTVNSVDDRIFEMADEGYDIVYTSISTGLNTNIEEIFVTSSTGRSIYGNLGAQIIHGGVGDDTLSGEMSQSGTFYLDGVADTLIGGLGNDIYITNEVGDRIVEFAGEGIDTVRTRSTNFALPANVENLEVQSGSVGAVNFRGNVLDNVITGSWVSDILRGMDGNDTLVGEGGDDRLIGDAGNDVLDGGFGIDTADYHFNTSAVRVDLSLSGAQDTGGAGFDTLIAIENLWGSAFGDRLTGDGYANVLTGDGGNDSLNGGAGNDTLSGGNGNDMLIGGSGNDTLRGDAGDDDLNGGDGNDLLEGGAGNDRLTGAAGHDTLRGGTGNDTYVITSIFNRAVELAGEGIDTVVVDGVSTILADNIENGMILSGACNLRGNGLANELTGSNSENNLFGEAGNDQLFGQAGLDVLVGGAGNDYLAGGADMDELTGGTGADQFVFTRLSDSARNKAIADIVTDFSHAQQDRIDLAAIDAVTGGADDAFHFIGNAAFNHAGDLRYGYDGAGNTIVEMDVDGDGAADMRIVLTGQIALVESDFIL